MTEETDKFRMGEVFPMYRELERKVANLCCAAEERKIGVANFVTRKASQA